MSGGKKGPRITFIPVFRRLKDFQIAVQNYMHHQKCPFEECQFAVWIQHSVDDGAAC